MPGYPEMIQELFIITRRMEVERVVRQLVEADGDEWLGWRRGLQVCRWRVGSEAAGR